MSNISGSNINFGDNLSLHELVSKDLPLSKYIFISTYDKENQRDIIVISNIKEAEYYKKISPLSKENPETFCNFWKEVKIYSPEFGYAPLCVVNNAVRLVKQCQQNVQYECEEWNSPTKSSTSVKVDTKKNKLNPANKQVEIKQQLKADKGDNINKSVNDIKIGSKVDSNLQNKNKGSNNEKIIKPVVTDKTINTNATSNTTIFNKANKISDTSSGNTTGKANSKNVIVKNSQNLVFKQNANQKNIKGDNQEFKKATDIKSSTDNTSKCTVDENFNTINSIDKTNTVQNTVKVDTIDRSLKKKLKKQKQKERKRDVSNSSSICTSESSKASSCTSKKSTHKKKNNKTPKSNESNITKDENSKDMRIRKTEDFETDTSTDTETKEISSSDDNMDILQPTSHLLEDINYKRHSEEFVLYSQKNKRSAGNKKITCDKKLAEKAVDSVLKNNLTEGLEYFIEALAFNSTDDRHYLNRSYCYLRMNKNSLALNDAQYVLHRSKNLGYRFIANLRAAQATFALENYHQAEMYLKEAIHINPDSYHAQRELLRVKIARIVSMGFKEKDVLAALTLHPSTLQAIEYLTEKNTGSENFETENDIEINYDTCDENVIYSSDVDEKPNNIDIINNMLNYKPDKINLRDAVNKPIDAEFLMPDIGDNHTSVKNLKKITVLSTKRNEKKNESKSIWVGNLRNDVDEVVLKKKFKQFGNIVFIHRRQYEPYAFIHFEKPSSVAMALKNSSSLEIAGIKLKVRSVMKEI